MKAISWHPASLLRGAVVAAGVLALAPGAAGAQQPSGTWQPWLGCWSAGPSVGGVAASAMAPVVCITPTADASVVEIATIAGDSVVGTQRIDAGGREQPLTATGCAGTQRAEWSADGRRVYLRAAAVCDGQERVTSGIIAMSPDGEWLDVQGVATGGRDAVRVARYHEVSVPRGAPARIASSLAGRTGSVLGSRLATGGTIGTTAVLEASRSVTPAVAEAWLMERGQIFPLDARELVRLADAGMPARVIDAMVAVSNPTVFAVARSERADRGARGARADDDDVAGRRVYVYMDPAYSPYGWGYSPYAYSALGYGRYGYGYGGGYYGYPGYQAPIVIAPQQPAIARGRAVKGRGYTQGDPDTASPAPASTRSTESSSSGSSRAGSGSQPSSQPAPRTAHPKP